MRILAIVFILLSLSVTAVWAENPKVALTTNKGVIVIALDADKAPITVRNFLSYVNEGFYSGTIFHRVIQGFMIQGGGLDSSMSQKKGHAPIKNEAANALKNVRYSIAMARTGEVDSATSQFFINTADNEFLNHGVRDFGYAVFGHVVEGQTVVDAIESVRTGAGDVPVDAVVIEKAEVIH